MLHAEGPTDDTRALLEATAWASVLNVRFDELERHLDPPPPKSSRRRRHWTFGNHPRLYHHLRQHYRRLWQATKPLVYDDSHPLRDERFRDVSPVQFNRLWQIAKKVAEDLVPVEHAAQAIGINPRTFGNTCRRYPELWKQICEKFGLGWPDDGDLAIPHLHIRAKMRKAAVMYLMGLNTTYISRRLGHPGNWLSFYRNRYQFYWGFLCEQERNRYNLPEEHVFVTRVENERGKLIARSQAGKGRYARAKRKRASRSEEYPRSACPIELAGPDDPVEVYGIRKPSVTKRQYEILEALVEAFPEGLTKGEIYNKIAVRNAPTYLKRLRDRDRHFKQAITMPGTGWGKGYRLGPWWKTQ